MREKESNERLFAFFLIMKEMIGRERWKRKEKS